MADSIQRLLKRRALNGTYPRTPDEIIAQFEAAARHWNRPPRRLFGLVNDMPAVNAPISSDIPLVIQRR